jgi:hypothetical protein
LIGKEKTWNSKCRMRSASIWEDLDPP